MIQVMASSTGEGHKEFWNTQARQVRLKVNLAWWLETMSAPLVVMAVIGAAALLWLRRELPETPAWMLYASVGGAVLCVAGISFWRAARKFEDPAQSLVRIEAAMRLRNALSAASAGVAPWPAPVVKVDAGLRWQWNRLWVPMIGALSLLAAGLWIPVAAKTTATATPPDQPQAWQQLAAELDYLAKEEVADEKYLEETRKKLDELKAQEEEQWFSHSSLEATDSLKKSHRAETERTEKELGQAEKALQSLEKNAGGSPAEKERLMEEFDQALEGLRNGAMKPNPELLEQLQNMDLKNLGKLDPQQLEQLKENLKKHGKCMGDCNGKGDGEGEGDGENWDDELLGENGEKQGQGTGKGGVKRGPGHDPNLLGAEKDAGKIGEMTPLESKDLTKSAPGDLLELQDGEHDVDQSGSRIAAGGNIDSTGKGGDRVWKDSLDPDEQRVLRKFFE